MTEMKEDDQYTDQASEGLVFSDDKLRRRWDSSVETFSTAKCLRFSIDCAFTRQAGSIQEQMRQRGELPELCWYRP